MPMPTFPLARLDAFRSELHTCLTRRTDALFELGDALLCAQAVPSLPHLSLEPAHRRGWGSAYAALAHGEVDAERLRDLLAGCLPPADPPVFAVDVTTWPRCDAECSPERGYYYHPSRHSAGQPIIAGWAFQWIAQLSFDRDSWTAPVDARRLHPLDDTDQTAAVQIRALLARLPAGRPVPLVVFDAGYDSAQLTLDLADERVAVLVRLRSGRCFYADPRPRAPGSTGRPRRHGAKFNCADPTTWPTPTATHLVVDDQYGTVTVAAWSGLHPKQQRHPGHGTRGPRPIVRGTIIRVQVERVPAKTRPPKVLWRWRAGLAGLHPPVRPGNSLYASDKTASGCCPGWWGSRSGSPPGRRSPPPGRSAAPPAGGAGRSWPDPGPREAVATPGSTTGRCRSPGPAAPLGRRPPAHAPAGPPPAG